MKDAADPNWPRGISVKNSWNSWCVRAADFA
jgi:hypothetical protein